MIGASHTPPKEAAMPRFRVAIGLLVLAGVGGPGVAVAQWRPDAVQRGVEDARERQRNFQE